MVLNLVLGMALDLHAMNGKFQDVHDLKIVRVRAESDLDDWVSVRVFSAPEAVVTALQGVHRLFGVSDSRPWRYFIGFVNGKPAATSLLFLGAEAAAVHWVVTLPGYRKKGIGAAMTLRALHEAREGGYKVAVLTASPYGIGIYRKIGFREFCTIRRYGWEPK